ncbi:MAG: hypothetical protein RL655_1811, partial [Pseudomonadota bacterium]
VMILVMVLQDFLGEALKRRPTTGHRRQNLLGADGVKVVEMLDRFYTGIMGHGGICIVGCQRVVAMALAPIIHACSTKQKRLPSPITTALDDGPKPAKFIADSNIPLLQCIPGRLAHQTLAFSKRGHQGGVFIHPLRGFQLLQNALHAC